MKFTQVEVQYVLNAGDANTWLRNFQMHNSKRKIININMNPAEPAGWFMTVIYEVEV